MFSIVIPVYKNEGNIAPLIEALSNLNSKFEQGLEVVFVVDGSPDKSYLLLEESLNNVEFRSQLIAHSRNFGSFAAILTGLNYAKGESFGVMAADLQEPPELMIDFQKALDEGHDIAVGTRETRDDPFMSSIFSNLFWTMYKKFVQPEIPQGGVDVFGCSKRVRDQLVSLKELNTSLVALLYWIGFSRKVVSYVRRKREIGVSAWTFKRKLKYLMDSVFAFTDLPIRLFYKIGFFSLAVSVVYALIIIISKTTGMISLPGYSATIVTILFFSALNSIGLAIIGSYTWRAYENTKGRPVSIVMNTKVFDAIK
ncbi:glycosyltransferase family 2 protein [Halobacteriovorax sp. GB3]|uniref:glycosyltransferase family 2 protein n=1 Tax=Halobacteriovorax sp. GB3 TaxID=2719615 RepID=UPI00236117C3|nr:glycosyltransferase family 2 protein [Halobacteriovorax sp. GB3]MDD0852547.1 glycosyltransferase family 2 protein [Halobacteriovorax sp. GB3]